MTATVKKMYIDFNTFNTINKCLYQVGCQELDGHELDVLRHGENKGDIVEKHNINSHNSLPVLLLNTRRNMHNVKSHWVFFLMKLIIFRTRT